MTYSEACQKGTDFMRFWDQMPYKIGRRKAFDTWCKVIRAGASAEDIIAGAWKYVAYEDRRRRREGSDYQPLHPTTWLNRWGWEDEIEDGRQAAAVQRGQYRARGDSMTADETRQYLRQLRSGG